MIVRLLQALAMLVWHGMGSWAAAFKPLQGGGSVADRAWAGHVLGVTWACTMHSNVLRVRGLRLEGCNPAKHALGEGYTRQHNAVELASSRDIYKRWLPYFEDRSCG